MLAKRGGGGGRGGGQCLLEWYPYEKDRTMGLNHQMASLSCALGEAFHTGRTLLLPAQICLFALHTVLIFGTMDLSYSATTRYIICLLVSLAPIHS